jgi:hypothetical protein
MKTLRSYLAAAPVARRLRLRAATLFHDFGDGPPDGGERRLDGLRRGRLDVAAHDLARPAALRLPAFRLRLR